MTEAPLNGAREPAAEQAQRFAVGIYHLVRYGSPVLR